MNRVSRYGIFALLIATLMSSPILLQAQDKDDKSADKDKKASEATPPAPPKEESSVTESQRRDFYR